MTASTSQLIDFDSNTRYATMKHQAPFQPHDTGLLGDYQQWIKQVLLAMHVDCACHPSTSQHHALCLKNWLTYSDKS